MSQNTNIFIIFGVIAAIVALVFVSVLMDMQNQLTQKDEEVETLQNQIVGLENDLGPVTKGAWNTVESFGGSSGFATDPFYVAGTELRMTWVAYTGVDAPISFSVAVYKEGQSQPVESFTNLQDQGTALLQNIENANYYLDISENNADQWSITVETWIPPNQ